ncbi:MAG: SpoIIE family protein phosphatase [Treponema sp.]|nr:SpoIIE family protein phosphatase [Treponema sp.]MBQ9538174.1 SpoIIE family protein phosphatase [Treponema sp.]
MKSKSSSKSLNLSSLIIRLPLYIVLFCSLLYIVNGLIGYRVFKSIFEDEYTKTTRQFAYTALSYIDGDRIEDYAASGSTDAEWDEADRQLNVLTRTAALAYIYVIVPDEKFESRMYIYDTVHPDVVNGKAYPLGQVSSLKHYDAEYIDKLKAVIMDGEDDTRFVYNKTGGHVTTSVPVKDSSGKGVAILSIVKPMSEVDALKAQYLRTTSIFSAILTVLFISIYIFLLHKLLTKPLLLLTKETASFASHKGELSGALNKIKGKSEIGILARAVEQMSVDMNRYIADLTHTTAEKERLSAELDVATQIQANMLPRIFPPYADHPEIELFASMDPAKEVGGDFYDFFMIGQDHFAVVVGDVSGKGVPAALFMVVAKTLLKNVGLQESSPARIFEKVNDQLCEGNDAGLFVTCWMGILTLSTGELLFANAGHTAPVIFHGGRVEYLTVKPNLMLAGMQGMKYKDHSTRLEPGDRIFVYTDGVTEATNSNNELYGENRLILCMADKRQLSAKELLEAVRDDVNRFVGDAPQFDDITMLELSLKILPRQQDADGGSKDEEGIVTKVFDATDENMGPVNDFVHSVLPADCPLEVLNKLDLAVEEVYINIAHYAYRPDVGTVEISCRLDQQDGNLPKLTVTFKDRGKPFNPLARKDPDITLSAEERDIGGLGIFLTKKFMDGVTYSFEDGQNVLTLNKTLA